MRAKIIWESHGEQPKPPHQLTRIGETMLKAMQAHPEHETDMRAIVVLLGEHHDHGEDELCGMPLGFCCSGYKGSAKLLEDLATTLQVVAGSRGIRVEISMHEVGSRN